MMKYLFPLISILLGIILLQPFQTKKLYQFESETSHGTAALLFFQKQLVDTISIDRLQTTDNSAVYIEFIRYTHEPPYDWSKVYGAEGNYRVFHNGHKISDTQLPNINEFSSPRLMDEVIIYWGFIEGSVYGFRTNLNSMKSDSVLIFNKIIATDFRYDYDFPIPMEDGLFLFRTFAANNDSMLVNFEDCMVTKLN